VKFSSFFDEFPKLIESEFRNIFITDNGFYKHIPPGNYAFLEMYCVDANCDCRKVIIHVISADPFKTWAVLNYGWEPEAYYRAWWGKSHLLYRPMSGVTFDPPTKDPLKQEFLKIFEAILQSDTKYARRLEAHYSMFKEAMQKKRDNQGAKNILLNEKVGRNTLCPCNSGKKFKKCCLLIAET
jgi:hypothetical protein